LSEDIQNYLKLVVRKDVSLEGKFLKNPAIFVSDFEISEFNMMFDLNEVQRKELLVSLISEKWNNKKKRFVRICEVMFDPRILIFAYADVIKAKGENRIELDGIRIQRIKELSCSLLNESWKPDKAIRVMILKKNGEFRPLTILSSMDKIVASAIGIVINVIFEKHQGLDKLHESRYFHHFSHGFRPNKGCHSALDVTVTWGLVSWFLKADIRKCSDTINQKRLISILNEAFDDQIFINTLNKIFKTPVKNIEQGGPDTSKGTGIYQGSPLSPILVNVYLNELDHFMTSLKKETDTVISETTEKWVQVTQISARELYKAKSRKAKSNFKRKLYRQKVKNANKARILRNSRVNTQMGEQFYHRLYYVRYLDDYLIAIKGPKKLAYDV
jgi:retron-type reverse transcriptase